MAITEAQLARINDIDWLLRPDSSELSESFRDDIHDGFFAPYSRLLSTFALLIEEDEIIFGSASPLGDGARLTLVTGADVLTADIPDLNDITAAPTVRIVPRASISGLSLSSDMKFDLRGSRAIAWPGRLEITAEYEGVGEVHFAGNAYDPHAPGNVGQITKLLDGLRADFRGATTS